jgi:hypothetical protein
METSVPWFLWLFPIAFTIHNIEEAFFLPKWSKTAGKFAKPVNTFEFVFALIILTTISIIITALSFSYGKQSFPIYLFFTFNFGMLLNVLFPHITATIVLKKYSPGLLTGIFFLAPITISLLLYGYNNEFFVFPDFWYITIPFAALIIGSIPLLFKLGKIFQRLISKS